jgi:Peptidase family M23
VARRMALVGLLVPCVWLVWLLAPWQARAAPGAAVAVGAGAIGTGAVGAGVVGAGAAGAGAAGAGAAVAGLRPAAAPGGPWRWPLDGTVLVERAFAPGPGPYSPGHLGADLRRTTGAPVRAAAAGRVTFAGLVAGRGVVVVGHPGGLRTTYEPVDVGVRPGQQVAAGARLGQVVAGHRCRAAGVCLHWGLRRASTYLDPVRLVRPGDLRLLPVGGPAALDLPPGVGGPAVTGGVPSAAARARPASGSTAGTTVHTGPSAGQAAAGWSLRASDLPGAGLAAAGLLTGLALVAGSRPGSGRPRPPDRPAPPAALRPEPPDAGPAASLPTRAQLLGDTGPADGRPVDLGAERLRRRAGPAGT